MRVKDVRWNHVWSNGAKYALVWCGDVDYYVHYIPTKGAYQVSYEPTLNREQEPEPITFWCNSELELAAFLADKHQRVLVK